MVAAVHASLNCRQCKVVPFFWTTGAVDWVLIALLSTLGLLYSDTSANE